MQLRVKNFQIHKEKVIDIPEGETTYLEGDSDIGKSAMMRAFRWIATNKPDGGSFVTLKSKRGTTAIAELTMDGVTVGRERGKSKNHYHMTGYEDPFVAFGTKVPEPIADFLKLSPYAFQLQGETPFLVGENPPTAAKILSNACGLGVIDTAVKFARDKKTEADADIRKGQILLESAEKRLEKAEAELPLAEALEKVVVADEAYKKIDSRIDDINDLLFQEPEGVIIDVSELSGVVGVAMTLQTACNALSERLRALKSFLSRAPVGEMYDLSGLHVVLDNLIRLSDYLQPRSTYAISIEVKLDHEPQGEFINTTEVREIVERGSKLDLAMYMLDGKIRKMREFLLHEPHSTPFNIEGSIVDSVIALRDLEGERGVLDGMCEKIRNRIGEAPQGKIIDTSELKKQRAAIPVCPTCGKEL